MPSRHKAPYCQGKIRYSQDEIKNMPKGMKCPHCGITIYNTDVCDTVQLGELVSLIKARGSKINIF